MWSPVSYSYSRVGEQKRLEQTDWRNERVSILGVWQPGESFEYALACGSFNSQTYIKVMDWLAQLASQTLKATGRMTVIVQDNGSLHTSHLTRHQWQTGAKSRIIPILPTPIFLRNEPDPGAMAST